MRCVLFWRFKAKLASPSEGRTECCRDSGWLPGTPSLAVTLLVLQPGGQAGAGIHSQYMYREHVPAHHQAECQRSLLQEATSR